MPSHRVLPGDRFQVIGTASIATEMRVRIIVGYDDGQLAPFQTTLVTTSDRVNTTTDFGYVAKEGTVVRVMVAPVTSVKRGQCFVEIVTLNRNRENVDYLAQGYINDGQNLPLDRFENSLSGRGHLQWVTLADDIAGNVADIERTLAATNAFRRIYGYVWYYNADGNASSRKLRVNIRSLGLALPTGYSAGLSRIQNYTHAADLTLTSAEEGQVYAYNSGHGDGFASKNDDGTATEENNTTAGQIFPMEIEENDLGVMHFDLTDGLVGDAQSIYLLQEEWIQI